VEGKEIFVLSGSPKKEEKFQSFARHNVCSHDYPSSSGRSSAQWNSQGWYCYAM